MWQEQMDIWLPLAVGALGGLAVGIEREWSGRADRARFAGVRTFLLIGLLGAVGVQLMAQGYAGVGLAILCSASLLIAIAYAGAVVHGEKDSTTEFAALMVLAAGALAGSGRLAIASAINAFTALVLVEKSRIHSLVYQIRSEELTAGFRFAVLALVVLPLLPSGPFGPEPGIRPRELWAMVLLFSGISFAGYIARRAAGLHRGYALAGFFGGLISSTFVTLNFSRESRTTPAMSYALALGVLAACTLLPVRVAVLASILNPAIGWRTMPYLVFPLIAGVVSLAIVSLKSSPATENELPPVKNPLRLLSAIQMVLAFQAALYVLHLVAERFQTAGIMVTAAVVGMTDVDTLTVMLTRQPSLDPVIASHALVLGVFMNTVLKLMFVVILGSQRFRVVTGIGLACAAAVTIAALFLV